MTKIRGHIEIENDALETQEMLNWRNKNLHGWRKTFGKGTVWTGEF